MSAYDPSFETALPAQLDRSAAPADAVRAALQLPMSLRFQGARCALFVAAVLLSRDPEMRVSARDGLNRATEGYDALRDLLADWRNRQTLHPALHPLFEETDAHTTGSLGAIDAYRAVLEEVIAALDAGGDLEPAIFDRVMGTAYKVFHPAMVSLSGKMAETGNALRDHGQRTATEARLRALDARDRIDTIARTVRLISLNARVEAAHAGDAGRAFGVIAEEIKTLSEQTETVSAEMGESVDDIMSALNIL
ncbi:hypothetical protein JANAI62_30280 [Jannaschia pagri]|uniref:Methyl-accepting transducer domain-containing protein n=1 Tax=Jannaschia pagri TaxID=2829797 RepID=A0ABQ4NQ45_9RHOB|nr:MULTISPECIES: methyl-accepting chemotaxis protein [unclassified Jannaschia]GIT92735.1 hypothetical protein JANAI61_31930 [Jannaschia sp. AI_61]GIT96405.1 hypothetical protein JANAI62_30280 [Jannaschia sp. AI_62]